MAESLFITGASGFIGRHVLAKLDTRQYDHVYCLTRSEQMAATFPVQPNVRWVIGDLFHDRVYGRGLAASDVVIHLAAATGKAGRKQHFSINAAGTRHLVEECRKRGTKKFVHVSSIAVKYSDTVHYDYARSKQEGEQAVMRSGLDYTILRPTIVLGPESATWKALSALARLPLVVVFGDGSTPIQPIEVNDFVDALISVVDTRGFSNQQLDVGGRDVIPIETFLRAVHFLYHTKAAKVVHIPVRPVTRALALADRYVPGLLPVSAGQLSVFVEDGTADVSRLSEARRAHMKDLNSVLKDLTSREESRH